jgi:5-methyltetrahydropteroyltriglutamate--homocysteine methyltransferase
MLLVTPPRPSQEESSVKRSTDRILTTHVGSLVKPDDLSDMIAARQMGEAYDEKALAARIKSAVAEVVRKQADAGIDIANDGEFSKSSWAAYFASRLSGVEVRAGQLSVPQHSIIGRDAREFPEWFTAARTVNGPTASSYVLHAAQRARGRPVPGIMGSFCTGPLKYIGQKDTQTDIENLKAGAQGVPVEELCLTSLAPPTMVFFLRNEHYPNDRDFLFAVADAMREEYRAIVDSGIVLQLDEPALAACWQTYPDMSLEDYRAWLELQVESLNHALQGIPEDRVRMHTCWGSIHHPHRSDIALRDILDIILKTNVGAYSFEASNPRHDHEWQVWKDIKLPDGKVLIPGVIGHFTDFIEHPELIAERLVKYANVVGKENVIAGVDCGLGTRVGNESIVWAKFQSMAEGARLASRQLWR